MGSDQPLLQIAKSTVRQMDHRFGTFTQVEAQRLDTPHMLESSLGELGRIPKTQPHLLNYISDPIIAATV